MSEIGEPSNICSSICHSRNFSNDENENSFIIDATPNFSLNNRKRIISILESEYFNSTTLNKENRGSFQDCNANEKDVHKKKQTFADIILPFDLNNKEIIAKKLSHLNKPLAKRKSLASNLDKERKNKSSPFKNNVALKHLFTKRNKSMGKSPLNNRSFEDSSNYENNDDNNKSRSNKNITKLSFENSNLDLTDANSGSDILLDDEICRQQPAQALNFSSFDSENESSSKLNSMNELVEEEGNIFSKNLSQFSNKKINRSIFKETLSPMSNFHQKMIEKELNMLSKSFQADSLTPTQPSNILILQGLFLFFSLYSL